MRARRARGGPRPLPEQQPGTSPPFSTPANRRKTPIEQLLRGGGRGIAVTPAKTRRGRVGGSLLDLSRGVLRTPRPRPSGLGPGAARTPAPPRSPQQRAPKDGRPPERGQSASGSEARQRPAPLFRPQAAACPPPGSPPLAQLGPGPTGPRRHCSPSSRLHS